MTTVALLVLSTWSKGADTPAEEGVSGQVWPPGVQPRLMGDGGSVMDQTHSDLTG